MRQHESEMATELLTGRADDEPWQLRKHGSRFWANGPLTALRDPTGKLRGFAKVTRDGTARKRAEDRLRETDRRKDEHLAMLAPSCATPWGASPTPCSWPNAPATQRTSRGVWAPSSGRSTTSPGSPTTCLMSRGPLGG